MIEKATGPDCPKCGCNDTAQIDAGRRGMYVWSKWECDACEHVFTKGNRTTQARQKAACPECGSKSSESLSTQGRKAYKRCTNCGKKFIDAI